MTNTVECVLKIIIRHRENILKWVIRSSYCNLFVLIFFISSSPSHIDTVLLGSLNPRSDWLINAKFMRM